MNRVPVSSSNVKSVGYDPGTETLQVEFRSGGIYDYSGVSADDHAALLKSPSVGSYIAAHIKGKHAHVLRDDLKPSG